MANFRIVQKAGTELSLDEPRPIDLDAVVNHYLGRPLRESDLEELVRRFPEFFLTPDDEDEAVSMLIVGQQVSTKAGGKADIVAIDGSGALVLVELKRDAEAAAHRYEPFEWQALRYAASYALFTKMDDLAQLLFAPYIRNNQAEYAGELQALTPEELARRKLEEFLRANNAVGRFNHKQRIILVAGSFERQVLSACAWLVSNGVDVSCVEVSGLEIGERYALVANTLLPTKKPSDYFVPVEAVAERLRPARTGDGESPPKQQLPRIADLLKAGLLRPGDKFYIKNRPQDIAIVVDDTYLSFQGKRYRYNPWGKSLSKWSAIDIYPNFILQESGESFDDLREKLAQQLDKEGASGDGAPEETMPEMAPTGDDTRSVTNKFQVPPRII